MAANHDTRQPDQPSPAPEQVADNMIRPGVVVVLCILILAQLALFPPQSLTVLTWVLTLVAIALTLLTGTTRQLFSKAPSFQGNFVLLLTLAVVSGVVFALPPAGFAVVLVYFCGSRAGEQLESRNQAQLVGLVATIVATLSAWGLPLTGVVAETIPWWVGLTVGFTVYAGASRRDRRNALAAAQQAAEQSRRAAASEAREAALEERGRIAREIHDVLGHSLTGIAMQLDMADALHGGGRDDEANQAVLRARGMAVAGMAETRRAIHALREDTLPLPQTLQQMAEGASAAFTMTGEPLALGVEMTQTMIRTAQESLTNARRHAPGAPVDIHLFFEHDAVRLRIADRPRVASESPQPGPASARTDTPADALSAAQSRAHAGSGMGLVGMRERAALLGGTLSAGPGEDGTGWTVTLELPLGQDLPAGKVQTQ